MNISNFKLTNRFGTSPVTWSFRGTVNCSHEVGYWFWKRTVVETKQVYKNYGGNWFWSETGTFTPGTDVEASERAWEAHNECRIEDYVFPEEK